MMTLNTALRRMVWVPILLLLAVAAQIIYWAHDDAPPFTGGKYVATPTRAGHGMPITREVTRDLKRTCTVTASRYLLDASGKVHDLQISQRISPEMGKILDTKSPNRRDEVIQLPKEVAPGMATINTALSWSCNPWQRLFPIETASVLHVEVLP